MITHCMDGMASTADITTFHMRRLSTMFNIVRHKLIKSISTCIHKSGVMLNKGVMFFLEEITKWIDEGSLVHIIYLDFPKAFDKVPYQRLLLKLKAHGIGDGIIDWTEQWLTDDSVL